MIGKQIKLDKIIYNKPFLNMKIRNKKPMLYKIKLMFTLSASFMSAPCPIRSCKSLS